MSQAFDWLVTLIDMFRSQSRWNGWEKWLRVLPLLCPEHLIGYSILLTGSGVVSHGGAGGTSGSGGSPLCIGDLIGYSL